MSVLTTFSSRNSFGGEYEVSATDKLNQIQQMALEFNRLLIANGEERFKRGGNLFLGRYYAESDRLYFGIKPGLTGRERDDFLVCLEDNDQYNRPFNNPEKFNRDNPYGKNFSAFLNANPRLKEWFNHRVTSTFLCPWRAKDMPELRKLNRDTGGKVYEYSGQLVRKMLEHHKATILVVAGKDGAHLLNEHVRQWDYRDINKHCEGPGGIYQWRKLPFEFLGRKIVALQIPHFAYANDQRKLQQFAQWLLQQVGPEPSGNPSGGDPGG